METSVEFINKQNNKSRGRSMGVEEKGSSIDIAMMCSCFKVLPCRREQRPRVGEELVGE